MMAVVVQLIVFLSVLISVTVSTDVFKVVGSSFQLDMPKTVHFKELKWMFNSKFMLKCNSGEVVHFPAYNGRVEFNKTTFSLTLKNLTKNDAGTYTVKGDDDEGENIIVVHTLTVLDSLEAPHLTYSLPQQSNGTCKVTCKSSRALSVSTNCYNETCDVNNVTSPNLSLFLHASGTTVICNVSNKAMWNQTTMEIKLCFPEDNKIQAKHFHLPWIELVLGSVVAAIIVMSIMLYKKNKTDFLQFPTPVTTLQNKDESPRAFRILQKPDPPTVYSTVQKSSRPPSCSENSQNPPNPDLITGQSQVNLERPGTHPITIYSTAGCSKPETVYATVKKTRNPSLE
ncbi:SLAM family member 5-like isoform X2 [Electrophorus electricus]|nr:SLAM family member 5-like isoform X2 [Electrophorus electricus]XP_035383885.1 SLAM family member 5-like isoform X2 [Electrophorus electricus]XP_035383886.1 SLAM family member 5-like isoform X2 [Electrophorus electricus]XP_035383887.1 SLAM family member 5-like isoform X2 [Electrophorus electricus]XP_035383888.1 SLAM family member 5-like isoform X2 [Electrophorus electricus]XP_035383889.1 SLAM family member 5-like isoform X2 [Electrophorus electricus]